MKDFQQFILSEQTKEDFYDVFERYADVKNAFVTFTTVQKVGINPQSHYNTPIGIYCYPCYEAARTYGVRGWGDEDEPPIFPFAANHNNFATFFEAKDPSKVIDDIFNLSKNDFEYYKGKLINIWNEHTNIPFSIENVKKKANNKTDWYIRSYGHQLWVLSRDMSHILFPSKSTISWNKIFRMIDVDGIIQRATPTIHQIRGLNNIIHDSEPIQGVFFSTANINVLEQTTFLDINMKMDQYYDSETQKKLFSNQPHKKGRYE